jgi:shikimate kinase
MIFLIGYMGSGKTTIGRQIAKALFRPFVDLDQLIEEEEGRTISRIFAERGEAAFREMERDYLRKAVAQTNAVISTGGGAPCFFDNMAFMNAQGLTVFFDLSPEELLNNLRNAGNGRPLIADKTDEELLKLIPEMLAKRNLFYSQAKLRVNPVREPLEMIVQAIEQYANKQYANK